MELKYQSIGTLEPGIYDLSWEEIVEAFGFNGHRQILLRGLKQATQELKAVGCRVIYLDGGFITKELYPRDFDACWDEENVNLNLLKEKYRGLMDFGYKMKNMKLRYGGTIVPMTNIADMDKGIIFFWFFQEDRQGREKGIIRLSLI